MSSVGLGKNERTEHDDEIISDGDDERDKKETAFCHYFSTFCRRPDDILALLQYLLQRKEFRIPSLHDLDFTEN